MARTSIQHIVVYFSVSLGTFGLQYEVMEGEHETFTTPRDNFSLLLTK